MFCFGGGWGGGGGVVVVLYGDVTIKGILDSGGKIERARETNRFSN